jgi:hypothetical protein
MSNIERERINSQYVVISDLFWPIRKEFRTTKSCFESHWDC